MCRLEVSLEKQRGGDWPSLTAEDEADERAAGLLLRGPVADQLSEEELAEFKKKIAEATQEEVNNRWFTMVCRKDVCLIDRVVFQRLRGTTHWYRVPTTKSVTSVMRTLPSLSSLRPLTYRIRYWALQVEVNGC